MAMGQSNHHSNNREKNNIYIYTNRFHKLSIPMANPSGFCIFTYMNGWFFLIIYSNSKIPISLRRLQDPLSGQQARPLVFFVDVFLVLGPWSLAQYCSVECKKCIKGYIIMIYGIYYSNISIWRNYGDTWVHCTPASLNLFPSTVGGFNSSTGDLHIPPRSGSNGVSNRAPTVYNTPLP